LVKTNIFTNIFIFISRGGSLDSFIAFCKIGCGISIITTTTVSTD
jgi:hypothetical protein